MKTEAENVLKLRNVRPTAMRLMVFDYLKNRKAAVTLADLENDFDHSERTTLYRTLKTFEKNRVVHQINDGSGIAKYALDLNFQDKFSAKDLHLHFHCNVCNATVCLTDQKIPHISLPEGFVAEDMNLLLKGICDNCT
ncbi:transcriptional repressor [Gramella sp. AN32]|uniref:Fur family transcriptional regulator n=1 Tax=Christiangramia antarctica TaxID=2058158 RepID=A0ABW5X3G3_9FLAO|nr:transcriptional repressor [Gramella sp. AN32]MCM4157722.1 transcriptional repressor [Gramella sp. AN32]